MFLSAFGRTSSEEKRNGATGCPIRPTRWPSLDLLYLSIQTNPLKSFNFLSYPGRDFSSILPTLLPFPLPYNTIRNPFSVTAHRPHPRSGGSRSNPVDHGRESPPIGVRVSHRPVE
jgi:hypothetical protein